MTRRIQPFLVVAIATLVAACGPKAAAPATEAPPAVAVDPATIAPAATEMSAVTAVVEAPPAVAGSTRFVIDPATSTATYTVDEEFFAGAVERMRKIAGPTLTTGSTSSVSGEMTVDTSGATPAATGEFVVDISTLASDEQFRDRRIREEWLESATYPSAIFKITSLEGVPADATSGAPFTFKMNGDLTIREVTKPVTFDVTATLSGTTLTGQATTNILMTDFGFEPPNMLNMFKVGNDVDVAIDFTMNAA
jgi:polyisoprenoid-binding protein YceI